MILRNVIFFLILLPTCLWAQAPSLTWQDNNEPFFAGFRVYYRTAYETEESFIDVGSRTDIEFSGLEPETKYFCRLTAYNIFGLESLPSEEITFFTAPRKPTIKRENGALKMSVEGRRGSTVDLYESTDLKKWTFVETLYNDEGVLDLTGPDTFSGAGKFYRLEYRGDSVEGWLRQQANSDPSATFPNSNFSNQYAYAVGLDLSNDPSTAQPKLGTIKQDWNGNEETFPTFEYHMREGTRDLSPRVEASHDGAFWFNVTSRLVTVESELLGTGLRKVVLREPLPIGKGASPRCFYRLRFDEGGDTIKYSAWLALKGNASPEGDMNNDGISNTYSFATGEDLLIDSSKAHPTVSLEAVSGGSERQAIIRYRMREGAAGVNAQVEYLDPETGWQSADSITSEVSNESNFDGTRIVTLHENSSPDSQSPRLYRVRYEISDP